MAAAAPHPTGGAAPARPLPLARETGEPASLADRAVRDLARPAVEDEKPRGVPWLDRRLSDLAVRKRIVKALRPHPLRQIVGWNQRAPLLPSQHLLDHLLQLWQTVTGPRRNID